MRKKPQQKPTKNPNQNKTPDWPQTRRNELAIVMN